MPNQFTNPWTTKEIELVKDNIGRLTYTEIGNLMNRSCASVQSKIRWLPIGRKIKKHFLNSRFFRNWSPAMSYVLGFIAADGNVCHSGRAHTLHIASDDLDVVEKIRAVMKYEGPIHRKQRLNGKTSYALRICDQIIFNDLVKLGITERKSLTIRPPMIPQAFIVDFLRGFFDGDGSVYLRSNKYPSRLAVVFYTASLHMAKFIHPSLRTLLKGLTTSNIQSRKTSRGTQYYMVSMGHKASAKLFTLFYSNTNLYMNRKFQKFLQGIVKHGH